jgi:hypothetical protein
MAALALVVTLSSGSSHAENQAQPADEWVGALSTDRFTDARWRIAAGRGTGDRGNLY